MNVLDKIEQRITGQQRPDDWRRPEVRFDKRVGLTGREQMSGFAAQAEHVLDLRLQVTFWANAAQVPDARRTAERVLTQALYADAHMALARIEHAISCSDKEQANQWCSELRKLIEGHA